MHTLYDRQSAQRTHVREQNAASRRIHGADFRIYVSVSITIESDEYRHRVLHPRLRPVMRRQRCR